MKGITPVIAVILLLLITIAMVGFAFVWFSRVATTAGNATQQALETQISQQAKRISIDNIDRANAAVTIRNIGSQNITATELALFVGGVSTSCTDPGWSPATIAPNAVATCDWATPGNCTAGALVRITAPGNADEATC